VLRWLARRGTDDARELAARVVPGTAGTRIVVEGLEPDAAPVLRATLLDAGGERQPALELFPPAELGGDALGARVVELPAGSDLLDDLGAGAALALDGARGPWVLPLEVPLAREFAGEEARVDLTALVRAARARPATPEVGDAGPAGPVLLLAGLLFLCVASVVAQSGGGQGFERDGR
jgi:hypothetical protein